MMTESNGGHDDLEKGLPRAGEEEAVSLEVEVLVSSPRGPTGGGQRKGGPSPGGSLPLEETNGDACRKNARAGSAAGSEKKAGGGGGKGKGKGKKKKRRRSAMEEEEDKKADRKNAERSGEGPPPERESTRGSIARRLREGGERRKMVLVISVFAAGIFITAVLLIAITLRLSPAIDEKIRKENEQMMNSLNRASNNVMATEENVDGTETNVIVSDSAAAAVVTINASVMGTEDRFGTSTSSTKATP